MTTFPPDRPLIQSVRVHQRMLYVEYADGRVVRTPSHLYPLLRDATDAQLENWTLIGRGVGVHWPDVDEDLSPETLIRDGVYVTAEAS